MPENAGDVERDALELERRIQNFVLDLRQAGFTVTMDTVNVEGRVLLTIMAQMGSTTEKSTGG